MSVRKKQAWPTKAVMNQVYEKKLWGESTQEFFSGYGSHNSEITQPYVNEISLFLESFEKPLSVCDLGCGDFNIGKNFVQLTEKYIAIDIVESLINYNSKKFKADNLKFLCLDIATDNLPNANCVFLRQVLQHLSNFEVQKILDKLYIYSYIIITEHIPEGDFISNLDIISGQGTRLKKNSGLDISKKPFNLKFKNKKELLSIKDGNTTGLIVTTLYFL